MKRNWIVLGSMAAVLLLAASAAFAGQGGQTSATATGRVEVSADEGGVKPEVHIWVNGKEVKPGESIDMGGLRIEGGADLKGLRTEGGERQAPQPFLGVMVGPVEEKPGAEGGARVNSVLPNSPAAEAGLAEGDIITNLGDTRINDPQQFVELIHGQKPGDGVNIKWTRNGKEMKKHITLAARPEQGPAAARRQEDRGEEQPATVWMGAIAAPLTPEVAQIAGTDKGVLINSLLDGSPGAQAGLLPGDVITAIDGKAVSAPGELIDIIRGHKPGDIVRLDYYRSGKEHTAQVKLAARPAEGRRQEGGGTFEVPEGLMEQVPELKGYMGQLRRWLEQNRSRRDGQQFPEPMPNMPMPGAPEMPQTPHRPYVLPVPPAATAPSQNSYDVGKDVGKILERLDRLDKRLGDIERRLDRIEKKSER